MPSLHQECPAMRGIGVKKEKDANGDERSSSSRHQIYDRSTPRNPMIMSIEMKWLRNYYQGCAELATAGCKPHVVWRRNILTRHRYLRLRGNSPRFSGNLTLLCSSDRFSFLVVSV